MNDNIKLSTLGIKKKTKKQNLGNLTLTEVSVDPSHPTRRQRASACGGGGGGKRTSTTLEVEGRSQSNNKQWQERLGTDILF